MSQWSHVSGTIRVSIMAKEDSNHSIQKNIDTVKNVLGPISTWEKPLSSCSLPMGSEGSIRYEVIQEDGPVTKTIKLSNLNIVFWGNLRDYGEDNFSSLLKWFHNTVKKIDSLFDEGFKNIIGIHWANILLEVEGKKRIVIWFDPDSEEVRYQTLEKGTAYVPS